MTNSPSVQHTQDEQHTAEVSKVITMDNKVTFEVTNSNIWLNHLATTTIIQEESPTDSLQSGARWRGRGVHSFPLFRHCPWSWQKMVGKKSPCGHNGLLCLDGFRLLWHYDEHLSMNDPKSTCHSHETLRFDPICFFRHDNSGHYELAEKSVGSCFIAGAKLRTPDQHIYHTE